MFYCTWQRVGTERMKIMPSSMPYYAENIEVACATPVLYSDHVNYSGTSCRREYLLITEIWRPATSSSFQISSSCACRFQTRNSYRLSQNQFSHLFCNAVGTLHNLSSYSLLCAERRKEDNAHLSHPQHSARCSNQNRRQQWWSRRQVTAGAPDTKMPRMPQCYLILQIDGFCSCAPRLSVVFFISTKERHCLVQRQ